MCYYVRMCEPDRKLVGRSVDGTVSLLAKECLAILSIARYDWVRSVCLSEQFYRRHIHRHTHTRTKWKKRSIIPYLLCLSIHLTRKVHRLAEMKIERLSFVPSPERPNGMPNCYGRCWAIIICRTGFMLLFQGGVCFHSVRVVWSG